MVATGRQEPFVHEAPEALGLSVLTGSSSFPRYFWAAFLEVVFFSPVFLSASSIWCAGPFQVVSDGLLLLLDSPFNLSSGRSLTGHSEEAPSGQESFSHFVSAEPLPFRVLRGGLWAAALVVCSCLQVISRWLLSRKELCPRLCSPIGSGRFATKEKNGAFEECLYTIHVLFRKREVSINFQGWY